MDVRPAWLLRLTNRVVGCLHVVDEPRGIGCHVAEHEGIWEVTLFLEDAELVGGANDGTPVPCRFQVDLEMVRRLFTRIERFSWQPCPMGPDDDLGANLSVEGSYGGRSVWLRVLARAPRMNDHSSENQPRFDSVW